MLRGERNRMKDDPTGKASKVKRNPGTDWKRLRGVNDSDIREAIEADPDAHPTDEELWKDAKVIWLRRKEA